MKIDTHTHIWDSLDFSNEVKRYTPKYLFTQSDLEKTMKNHNIKKAVLVQPSFLGNDNSLLVKTVSKNPKKYRGVIVLDDFDTYENLKLLLISYNNLGIKGIRFNLIGKKLPNFRLKKYQDLFYILNQLNWHLEIHANEDDICKLFTSFNNFNLKIVLDHFARPKKLEYSEEFISLLKRDFNIYVKLSANYRFNDLKIDNFINDLITIIGKEKLLWGSDCPFTRFENIWSYKKSIDLLTKNILTKGLEEVLDNNAKKLFQWN
ncbi:amidohydrolase [Arcobacter sp. F155]|uniref:amidohydrolase family protein n=1 Tax=Arcobacter sp. F155 TaxID=2044512 RepID=UPI00100B0169|nr:amidohydrolase family protein [Arcobacter sp. F155]